MATTEIKSLLHFDESATKDECCKAVWTLGENATLSSAQKKFGSNSLYLPTADSFIKGTPINKTLFYTNETGKFVYEYEFWLYFEDNQTNFTPFILKPFWKLQFKKLNLETIWAIYLDRTNDGNSDSDKLGNVYDFSSNSWHHIFLRFSFVGGNGYYQSYIFIDGQNISLQDNDGYEHKIYYHSNNDYVILGNFVGYIDEFAYRVIKVDEDVTVNLYQDNPNSMTVPISPYVYVASEADKIAYENRFKTTPYTDDENFTENFDIPITIQFRRGTKAVLETVNPILARGEIMVEVDTGQMKIGTGTRRWNNLKYVGDF